MKKYILLIIICISLSSLAWADAQEDRIAQLEQRIQQLEARIAALETLLTPAPTPSTASTLSIPADIDQRIRTKAAERYPENFVMQEASIKTQRDAYQHVQHITAPPGVPAAIFQKILAKVRKRYPENFVMQEASIKTQIDAYLKLQQ